MHLPNLVTTQIRCDYCVWCALFHKTDFPFFVCVLQTNLPALMRQLGDVRNNGDHGHGYFYGYSYGYFYGYNYEYGYCYVYGYCCCLS